VGTRFYVNAIDLQTVLDGLDRLSSYLSTFVHHSPLEIRETGQRMVTPIAFSV